MQEQELAPKELRSVLRNLALARRRAYDIAHAGTLASIEFEYELEYIHHVTVHAFNALREVYRHGFTGTDCEGFTWNTPAEEAGVGEGDSAGYSGGGE